MSIKYVKRISTSFLMLTMLMITSCGSDDNGIAGILFVDLPSGAVGVYTGDLAYTNGSDTVVNDEGTATISGSGTYTISFSDDVPSITGLRFILTGGEYVSVSTDGTTETGIVVDGNSLEVANEAAGGSIAFDGDR